MAEVYGPVFSLDPEPATFADRAGNTMRRQMDATRAAAEVARQQWQRRQAAQKGQQMKTPSVFEHMSPPTFKDTEQARRDYLLSLDATGRAVLAGNKPLVGPEQPAQFAESPIDTRRRELLAMTPEGRAALEQMDRQRRAPAMFAHTAVAGMTARDLQSADALARHVNNQSDLEAVVRYVEQGGYPDWKMHDHWRVLRDVAARKGLSAPPSPYHLIRNAANVGRR